MFKVNDKVKILGISHVSYTIESKVIGKIGTITYIAENEDTRFIVDIGVPELNGFGYAESELELIESIQTKPVLSQEQISKHPSCPISFNSGIKQNSEKIRTFGTGATRDTDLNKLDYEGFLSPLVLERYAQYLNKHRVQSDGQLRDSDNWQKGIPKETYIKSKFRHFVATWLLHRNHITKDEKGNNVNLEESLCGDIFNTMGYLHELLKEKESIKPKRETTDKSDDYVEQIGSNI